MMPPVSARIFGVNVRLAPDMRPKGTRARARSSSDCFTRALTDKSSRTKSPLGHQERFSPPRLSGGWGFQSGPLLQLGHAKLFDQAPATYRAMCRESRRGLLPPLLPDLTAAPSAD
jgi:hypothetical protein